MVAGATAACAFAAIHLKPLQGLKQLQLQT